MSLWNSMRRGNRDVHILPAHLLPLGSFGASFFCHFPECQLTHLTSSRKPTLSFSPLTLPGFHQGALAVTSCTFLLFSGPGTLPTRPHMTVSPGFLPRSISVLNFTTLQELAKSYQQTRTLSTQAQARNPGREREGSKVPVLTMDFITAMITMV